MLADSEGMVTKHQHGTVHMYKAHLLGDLPASPGTVPSSAPAAHARDNQIVTESELLHNAPYNELAGMSPQQRAAWQHTKALRQMRTEADLEHRQAVVALHSRYGHHDCKQ